MKKIITMLKLILLLSSTFLLQDCTKKESFVQEDLPCQNKETKLEQKWEILYQSTSLPNSIIEYKVDSTFHITNINTQDTFKGTWILNQNIISLYYISDNGNIDTTKSEILKLECDTLRTGQIYPPHPIITTHITAK